MPPSVEPPHWRQTRSDVALLLAARCPVLAQCQQGSESGSWGAFNASELWCVVDHALVVPFQCGGA
jgi:hypothetical protein